MSASKFPIPGDMGQTARPGHVHTVQFYDEDSGMIEGVCSFLGEALEAGNAALIVATPEHRETVRIRLAACGVDVEQASVEGRYVGLDADETLSNFVREGWPDPERFKRTVGQIVSRVRSAARGNPRRLAVFGEMVAILWAQGKTDSAVQLERLWNELQQTESFALHCAYPMKVFERQEHASEFLAICREHSQVIPGESFTSLTTEDARLRTVSELQQKARAFDLETAEKNGLRELSSQLLRVQDEERRRIARELHDGVGQDLALLSMNLSALEDEASQFSASVAKALEENAGIVRKTSSELRSLSYSLYPPLLEEVGLEPALHWYVENFHERNTISIALELSPDFGRLPRERELAIFRVIQECLTNVHRHSGSRAAAIRMVRSGNEVQLTVRDEGKGIAPEKLAELAGAGGAGTGLRGMRERVRSFGGQLQIHSAGNGTEIRMVMPAAD